MGTAGTTGSAGTTGTAGTAGGVGGTTGTAGQSGAAGTAGRGGAGGTAGTGAPGGRGGAGGTAGGSGTGGTGGAVDCRPGATCTGTESCSAPCGGGRREIACFCDPNGLFACEACLPIDSGAGGTGVDAGVPACPANPMGMDCLAAGAMCATDCAGGMAQSCMCQVSAAGGPDGGPAMRWRCQSVRCQ
jgi:hypothetical protein